MRCAGGVRLAGNGQGARAGQRCVGSAVKILIDAQKTSRSAMMARTTTGAADRACLGGKSSKGRRMLPRTNRAAFERLPKSRKLFDRGSGRSSIIFAAG